ncbi:trypsin-like peptidase domain-containing protein [Streptomyces sp. NPDC051211]|uniref:nSTAND1 domain-containing NTPase n=1 Tax=Streptomyces sp. NPDC051211 TaxID=3154643 RepID=UPI00344B3B9D
MDAVSAAPSDAAVARILDAGGVPHGAGFRAGQREVITCAHVVAKALGMPDDTREAPDGRLWIDFPLAARGTRVEARIGTWTPVGPDGSGDVAVLRLLTDPPARVPIARLVEHGAAADRRVRTFGFPAGYDLGAWSVGWLRGATGTGWLQYDADPASEHRVVPGFSGAPVWDVAEGGVVGIVVAADDRADVRTGYLIPTEDLRESWSGLLETALPACPFRSLEPFEERDAPFFHGRAEPARRIADLLGHAPVTNLVGPSGCGKSSLLFAGVLPLLRGRPGLEVVVFRPGRLGRSPLEALALALLPLLEPDLTETARLAELPALAGLLAEGRIADVVERLLGRQGKDRLLVVVDQFEEALTGTERADVDALAAALAYSLHPGSRLRIVTTLRADFLTPVLGHPGLAPLFAGDRLFTVGAMSDEELREAVVRPPEASGVSYEPGLVDRLLDDVGTDPGRLPLLEFTLTRLWERQRHGRIGHAAYESLGRVHDALVTHAEQIWTGALSETEQRAARALLVQLVHPGDGGTAPTRRTLARSELRPEQWRLAQRLMTTRLVVPGEDYHRDGGPPEETVELAHETLLTQWGRLRAYFEQDREFRTWQEGIRRAIAVWSADARPARRLLRGQELRDARKWRTGRPGELRPSEEAFIAASERGRRRRATVATALVAVLALLGGGGFLVWQTGVNEDKAGQAAEVLLQQSRDAEADMGGDGAYTALLLALRAYRTDDSGQTRARLGELHARYGFADVLAPRHGIQEGALLGLTGRSGQFATGAGGRVTAARSAAGEVLVLRRDGAGLRRTGTGRQADVVAVSPDGTVLAMTRSMLASLPTAAPSEPADLRGLPVELYDVQGGTFRELERPAEGDLVRDTDLDLGLSEVPGLGVDLPDIALPDIPGFDRLPTTYERFAFTPDSTVLVAKTGPANKVGRLVLWNVADGRIRKTMPGLPELVDEMWPSAGGDQLLTLKEGMDLSITLKVWDLRGKAPAVSRETRFKPPASGMTTVDLSPGLTRLAVVEGGVEGMVLKQRLTVQELPGGRVVRQEAITQQENVSGVSVTDEGDRTLLYSTALLPLAGAPEPGPVVRIGGTWQVDLAGTAAEPAAVLSDRGLVAVVGPGGDDPVGRLPAPAGKDQEKDKDKDKGQAPVSAGEAARAMAAFCRILGDETLPASVEGKLPYGAHRGPLCEGLDGTRG